MLKFFGVIFVSLICGIAIGYATYALTNLGVNEGFEPANPAATTDTFRPSQ
ncbi:MAG TPA: hypothetical protein PKD64_11100 [Pirellulaceae bacterium]|nr:hypothetical protein [Pirellulaceae bacterium]HMO92730.1 hypothetical protein [Pirellulaceae bacterium]HMP70282.1 hypothetical protein [Pirellulaceae bacterium]